MAKQKTKTSKNPIKKLAAKAAVPQKLTAIKRKASRIEPSDVAKGAAAVSIAAGVIAAGAALMDKGNRQKLSKTASKGAKFVKEMASEMGDEAQTRYQSVAQSVPLKRTSSKKQNRKKKS